MMVPPLAAASPLRAILYSPSLRGEFCLQDAEGWNRASRRVQHGVLGLRFSKGELSQIGISGSRVTAFV